MYLIFPPPPFTVSFNIRLLSVLQYVGHNLLLVRVKWEGQMFTQLVSVHSLVTKSHACKYAIIITHDPVRIFRESRTIWWHTS